MLFYTYQFNNPGNLINAAYSNTANWVSYNQNKNYSNNGFVAGFLFNTGSQYMMEPIDYSIEKVISIKDEYTNKAEEINKTRNNIEFDTNIIFLMNESFSDPSRLKGFESNLDPIPFTRELMMNTLSGNSLAQSIGGGTANSEFEALTSLSLEPFSSHVYAPYVEATSIFNHIHSILERVHASGLKSTAIHSHSPSLYKRTVVYSEMGFDEFISKEDMLYTEKIANSDYISDASAYKEMIKRMNETEEKDFIHLVTMQNHMSYRLKYEETKFNTSGADDNEEGNGYLQDLYNSDIA